MRGRFLLMQYYCKKLYNKLMTNTKNQKLRDILLENNFSVTKARLATFDLLVSDEPQSIAKIIKSAEGKVDRVTVYRNIELFEKLGIVNRIYYGWKYKIELSDQFISHHHHISCIGCGKVVDIQDEKHIDEFIVSEAKRLGFKPVRHQFEIEGLCETCIKTD